VPFQKSSPPRYLPTLTEVVHLAPSSSPSPDAVGVDAISDRILDQLQPAFEAEIRKVAHDLLEAQLSAQIPVLQQALQERVRQAVQLALAESGHVT
jgi:hypothetical protein